MKFLSCAIVLVTLIGCTKDKVQNSVKSDPASLAPAPKSGEESSLAHRLNRYSGQKDFLTLGFDSMGWVEAATVSDRSASPDGGGRAEQESDVFKVGLPGSKMLYLLNSNRGLQVVSFEKGVKQPQLIGRVNPTGNYSETMYSDLDRGRLMVLENHYDGETRDSRIVVYNVKNPSKPFIMDTVEVKGRIVDSRIVGDVLYLATYTHSSAHSSRNFGFAEAESVGMVQSFNLKGEKIGKVEEFKMQLPIAYGELINIQTVGTGAAAQYYLVGVQSESGWLWWDRQSAVEVIDITSPTGKIKPLMTAYAKGQISERSQTKIYNGYLVVTSNYNVGETDDSNSRIARVAVEAFKLPGQEPEVLSADEAEYRRLHIERALKEKTEAEQQLLREQLLADAELGLKGRFIAQENGSLKKLIADSTVTTGDTNGLSAALQDVRYQDNLLYVFWVPSNMVDPLDVFNLADLESGIKYEGRLEYDGWIARSFPITYKGRKFIVGLGWVVENVNNERARRYPQAMIFEVKNGLRNVRNRETGKIEQVESIVLEKVPGAQVTMNADEHVWANLNGVDREIELRMDSESRGEILFQAYKWGANKSSEGGQLIRFDLEEAFLGLGETALEVGPFLAGSHGWLRRIFNNSEIGMINAFSSEVLSTFDTAALKNTATATAVSVLELARDVSKYLTLKSGDQIKGVQIINRTDYMTYETVVRLVSAEFADAEKSDVQAETKVNGRLLGSLVIENGSALLLLTGSSEYKKDEVVSTYTLSRVRLGDTNTLVVDQESWKESASFESSMRFAESNGLTVVDGSKILVSTGNTVKVLESGKSFGLQPLALNACPQADSDLRWVELKEVSGQLAFVITERLESDELRGVQRKSIAMARLEGGQLSCSSPVNIPGEPVMLVGNQLITQDQYSKDTQIVQEGAENRSQLKTVPAYGFTLVQVDAGVATLQDSTEALNRSYGTLPPNELRGSGKLVFLKSPEDEYNSAQLASLEIESDRLVSSVWQLADVKGSWAQLVGLTSVNADKTLAVVSSSGAARVFEINGNNRPTAVSFRPVREDGSRGEPTDVLPGNFYSTDVHFTPEQNSLEVSSGLRGIIQLFL